MRDRRAARWSGLGAGCLVLASLAPAGPPPQVPAGEAALPITPGAAAPKAGAAPQLNADDGPVGRIRAWRLDPPAPAGPEDGPARAASRAGVRAATSILRQLREMLFEPPVKEAAPGAMLERLASWSRRLADAQLELADGPGARAAILGEALGRARDLEDLAKDLVRGESMGWSGFDLDVATFARAEAETRLLREKDAPAR